MASPDLGWGMAGGFSLQAFSLLHELSDCAHAHVQLCMAWHGLVVNSCACEGGWDGAALCCACCMAWAGLPLQACSLGVAGDRQDRHAGRGRPCFMHFRKLISPSDNETGATSNKKASLHNTLISMEGVSTSLPPLPLPISHYHVSPHRLLPMA